MSATTALGAAPEGAAMEDESVQQEPAFTAETAAEIDEGDPTAAEADQTAARQEAAERIRQAAALPPGLRTRLADLVESGGSMAANGRAVISADDAVIAIEQALPEVMRVSRRSLTHKPHPAGAAFFGGDSADAAEQEAEAIARGQLERSGLLRGQRARAE